MSNDEAKPIAEPQQETAQSLPQSSLPEPAESLERLDPTDIVHREVLRNSGDPTAALIVFMNRQTEVVEFFEEMFEFRVKAKITHNEHFKFLLENAANADDLIALKRVLDRRAPGFWFAMFKQWRELIRNCVGLLHEKPAHFPNEAVRALLSDVPEDNEMIQVFDRSEEYGVNELRRMVDSEDTAFEAVIGYERVYCYGHRDLATFEEKVVKPCRDEFRIVHYRWWKTPEAASLFASLQPGQSLQVRARGSGKRLSLHVQDGGINVEDLKALEEACGASVTESALRNDPLAFCYDFHGLRPIWD